MSGERCGKVNFFFGGQGDPGPWIRERESVSKRWSHQSLHLFLHLNPSGHCTAPTEIKAMKNNPTRQREHRVVRENVTVTSQLDITAHNDVTLGQLPKFDVIWQF